MRSSQRFPLLPLTHRGRLHAHDALQSLPSVQLQFKPAISIKRLSDSIKRSVKKANQQGSRC